MKVISLKDVEKIAAFIVLLFLIVVCIAKTVKLDNLGKNKKDIFQTSATLEEIASLSNKKIEWGIKRAKNNEQPDLGSQNKELINKYNGM